MLYALCHLRIVLLTFGRFLSPVKEGGMVRPFLKKVSHKAPSTHNEGGAFFFSCLVGLKAYFTGAKIISLGHPVAKSSERL